MTLKNLFKKKEVRKMRKFYLREEDRNEEERKTGYASYRSLVNRYIQDLVLCNNIAEVDGSTWDNVQVGNLYNEENDEYTKIYQFYLCNLSESDITSLKELTNDNNDIRTYQEYYLQDDE